MTGPVSRGDVGTVAGHLDVLEESSPAIAETYRAMARATAERAIGLRRVPPEQVGVLRELLRTDPA